MGRPVTGRALRVAAALVGALLVASLAGCYPTARSNQPSGEHHVMRMVVEVRANEKPVAVFVDVTKSDVVIRTGEHGINRDSGRPYPAKWRGTSPQHSEIDYWSGSNPTTFVFQAQVSASRVRTLKQIGRNAIVRVSCFLERDGRAIPSDHISGQQVAAMTPEQARTTMQGRELRVSCSWTDHSA